MCLLRPAPTNESCHRRTHVAFSVSLHDMLIERIGDSVGGLATASPEQLWLAAAAFLGVIVATGCAWRAGIRACGGTIGVPDASARYAVGSLVNSVAPGGIGGAVRIALFSRALERASASGRPTGVATTIGIARTPALALARRRGGRRRRLPALAAARARRRDGSRPSVVAVYARGRTPHARVAHVLDAFRALGRSPRAAASLVGWVTVAMAMRLLAAATIAAAFDVASPLAAAVVMLPRSRSRAAAAARRGTSASAAARSPSRC